MTEFFIHRGVRLEYMVSGQGCPLVFLHGLGGSIRQIQSTFDPTPGVQLIVLNQQGHGSSGADWETYSFDRLGEDVLALLDFLKIEKASFAGISMGAAVSLNIAVRFAQRVERMLLIRNAWTDQPMSEPVRRAYLDLGQSLHLGGLEAFRQTAGWEIVSKTTPYTKNAFTAPFQEEFNVKNWKKFLLLPSQAPIASLDALRNLHIPVMILANENDFCHPYAYGKLLERTIPKAIFRQIPDKDSDPAEHRRQINLAVRELLGFPCDSAKQ